jgi:hypothetical protein
MTKQNLTAITLIVDRSGSMNSLREEAQGTLDRFIKEQQEVPGELLWTVVLFDDFYERPVFMQSAIADRVELHPRGMTALNDAVGRTVSDMGKHFSELPEDQRPDKVVVAILTDGYENHSKEYTTEAVRKLVTSQTEEWNWNFIYLATGLDRWAAEAQAMHMGVPRVNTMSVNRRDHHAGGQSVSYYVADLRAGTDEGSLRANVAKTDPGLLEREDDAGKA